jgi:hypothetical protein
MLDLRFKSLYIISSFIDGEKVVDIVKEYERQFLYHMLLKCYHHLHPMEKFEVRCAKQRIDERFQLR